MNRHAERDLEILTASDQALCDRIDNAGAIFLGPYSPVAVGDYAAGPSHVLPTGGTARFASPLGTEDFVKRSSVIEYSRAGLTAALPHLSSLARLEGLQGHGRAAEARREGTPQ